MDNPREFVLEQLDNDLISHEEVAEALLAAIPKDMLNSIIETYGWNLQDDEEYEPNYPNDLSDDAEALASAGMGTDEGYGYFGGDDY